MEQQLRIVKLGAAVYLVYGLLMLLDLGVFLPPVPLKMLFISFFACYLGLLNYKKYSKLYSYLLLYGLALILSAVFFLEIVFSQTDRFVLEESNTLDYVALAIQILLSALLLYLSFQNKNQKVRINILPILVLLCVWIDSFFPDYFIADIAQIVLGASFLYVFQTSDKDYSTDELAGLRIFFVGVAMVYTLTLISQLILFLT